MAALHGGDDLGPGELVPGGGEDGGLGVLGAQQIDGGVQLALVHALGAGEEDGGGVLHLVVEELAEVLHVDPGLGGVHHGDEAVELKLRGLPLHPLHGGDHVGQFSYAGGLDDDAVGGVVLQHLFQGGAEVAHQGAADAAGVHLGDLHSGVLQEAAVNADLAELVLDEHVLLALEGLAEELLDEGGLAGSQETGDNVDLRHGIVISFLKIKINGILAFPPLGGRCPRRGRMRGRECVGAAYPHPSRPSSVPPSPFQGKGLVYGQFQIRWVASRRAHSRPAAVSRVPASPGC